MRRTYITQHFMYSAAMDHVLHILSVQLSTVLELHSERCSVMLALVDSCNSIQRSSPKKFSVRGHLIEYLHLSDVTNTVSLLCVRRKVDVSM
jgi:hypothetical protein